MIECRKWLRGAVAVLTLIVLVAQLVGAETGAKDFAVGVGFSRLVANIPEWDDWLPVTRACAAKAALEAKVALGGAEPKLVLFFESWRNPRTADLDPLMLDEIAKVFPREKVYGCSAAGIQVGNAFGYFETIGVLALGGDGVEIQVKTVEQEAYDENGRDIPNKNYFSEMTQQEQKDFCQKHYNDGRRLGEALGQGSEDSFLIMLGHLHHPMGQHAVKGVQSVLGERFPMIGSCTASWGGGSIFVQGRQSPRMLIGIMVTMKRKFTMARGSCPEKTPEKIAESTGQTMQAALDELNETPSLIFGIECVSRMTIASDSGKKIPGAFLTEVQKRSPAGAVRFIFGGSGEIGPARTGEAAWGGGSQSVTLCIGGAMRQDDKGR